ncbi:MAG: hypothetical protein A6F71_06815 [Cycloclasticus sp. symbiont of Poecilosclerida sp. M]|nr:MAG: hypothetical protein A6F71_06815 [Cycloclasticus sp. symbiont of Poecilosclerida sp. M]
MKQHSDNIKWVEGISDFYNFITKSREFSNYYSQTSSDKELILKINELIEIAKTNSTGNEHLETKFESAI